MSKTITARPLTRKNFAPFGDVIDTGGDAHYPINGGKTERYHALARPEATGPGGHVQPGQGVNYPRNRWHGVLTPIGEPQDFLIVDRGGAGNNLEEFFFPKPYEIHLP